MNANILINDGLALMALGMGFVFVFLTLLVAITTLMSKAIGRFFPVPVSGPRDPASHHDEALMAVIAVAVHRYRRRHHR
tara:strand:+ start:84 stop:320 length:237 start_codon:yes stop_codon:yes gene_type:complete